MSRDYHARGNNCDAANTSLREKIHAKFFHSEREECIYLAALLSLSMQNLQILRKRIVKCALVGGITQLRVTTLRQE